MKRVMIPVNVAQPPAVDAAAALLSLKGITMGTTWSVKLVLPSPTSDKLQMLDASSIQVGIQQRLDLVDRQMSTWDPSSDLCRFNMAPAQSWQPLPTEFFKVLDYALYTAQQTEGAFDPAIGHLVDLWGYGPTPKCTTVPDLDAVLLAQKKGGWRQLQLDSLGRRAYQAGGVHLDFSGIAKGYGVDLVAEYLASLNIVSFLVEVGGELRGYGVKPDQQPWWVELEMPGSTSSPAPANASHAKVPASIVALHELAIATSGDYRNFFVHEGRRYSHTIDPRSGHPIAHQLASVTVLHPSCMVADVMATALTVMGLEAGMAYAREQGIAARFICRIARPPDASQHEDGADYLEQLSPALTVMLD